MARKPTLTKTEVNYRAGDAEHHCGNCVMFRLDTGRGSSGRCDLVIGLIDRLALCDRWESPDGEKLSWTWPDSNRRPS